MSLLIGLVGRAGAGKDTVGRMLVTAEELNGCLDTRPFRTVSFAAPLKKICGDVFAFTNRQLHGDQKEVPDPRYQRADGTYLTPREAMQVLGTQWGRACYPHVWVELGLRHAKEQMANGLSIAITDVRFINEAKAIKEAGGQVWRVLRPEAERVPAVHTSEAEMNRPEMGALVDKYITNYGTFEELRAKVFEALET